MRRRRALMIAAFTLWGCGDNLERPDAAAPDAALADAAPDAATPDAALDAGPDATGLDAAPVAVSVTTQHNDLARTGANLGEQTLDTSNVTAARFGKLFSRAVDDEIYAQPLVLGGIAVGGRTRNVVYVATVNDSLYAFDADDPAAAAPLWQDSLIAPGARPPEASDITFSCDGHAYTDFNDHMGIVGTPVIDPGTGTLYVVARSVDAAGQAQYLYALDVHDGSQRPGSPMRIEVAAVLGRPAFDALHENQRAGLLLRDGTVYIAWAGHCDWSPYHGWLIGYDAGTLAQTVVYLTTPSGDAGGIWMAGQAPSADADGIYAISGNGDVGVPGDPTDPENRSESFLRLTRSGASLSVASYFTPNDWDFLNQHDLDLGGTGALLVPGTELAVGGGKTGILYVVDRLNMGGLGDPGDPQIVQQITDGAPHALFGSPVYWAGPDAAMIYLWAVRAPLYGYRYDPARGRFTTPPFAVNAVTPAFPGAMLSLSAHGSAAGTGILWASHPNPGTDPGRLPGVLRAFDAANPARQLWSSLDQPARDAPGTFAKFAYPTVANGKVFLATFSHVLCVYGLL